MMIKSKPLKKQLDEPGYLRRNEQKGMSDCSPRYLVFNDVGSF